MRRMWTIARKELIHIIRDPRTLGLAIFMPVLLLLLLGYAVATDIEDLPLAVADQSKTDMSRDFVDKYEVSGYFLITHYVDSETDILEPKGVVRQGKHRISGLSSNFALCASPPCSNDISSSTRNDNGVPPGSGKRHLNSV